MVIICEIRICNFITYSLSTQNVVKIVTSACKASSLVMNIFHMVWCKKNLNLNFHGHEFTEKWSLNINSPYLNALKMMLVVFIYMTVHSHMCVEHNMMVRSVIFINFFFFGQQKYF